MAPWAAHLTLAIPTTTRSPWLTWLWSEFTHKPRILDLATGVWNASLECGHGAYDAQLTRQFK